MPYLLHFITMGGLSAATRRLNQLDRSCHSADKTLSSNSRFLTGMHRCILLGQQKHIFFCRQQNLIAGCNGLLQ